MANPRKKSNAARVRISLPIAFFDERDQIMAKLNNPRIGRN